MGRYPFVALTEQYLEAVHSTVTEATLKERRGKLLYVARILDGMKERGEVGTTNPAKFGKREIDALALWMRSQGFGLDYQAKLWSYLRGLLEFVGNPILTQLEAKGQWKRPKNVSRPVYVKDEAWFEDALRKLEAKDGWRATVVRACTAVYIHTGLRPKELRLASMDDLSPTEWSLTVAHPKGEGSWAVEGEKVYLFPSLRSYLIDYLEARAKHLRDLGFNPDDVRPLFPNELAAFYSETGWRSARWKVFKELGIRGSYRVLRPTFAQKLKDRGARIEEVSRALRHTSVATTEKFYARIRSKAAWDSLERTWETPSVQKVAD